MSILVKVEKHLNVPKLREFITNWNKGVYFGNAQYETLPKDFGNPTNTNSISDDNEIRLPKLDVYDENVVQDNNMPVYSISSDNEFASSIEYQKLLREYA